MRRVVRRFRVIPAPSAEPRPRAGESPRALVRRLALWKARRVAERLPLTPTLSPDASAGHGGRGIKGEGALVIGADTIVVSAAGRILGKPGTAARARRMLAALSGTWHRVYTGMAVVEAPSGRGVPRRRRREVEDAPRSAAGVAVVRVKMRRLSILEIARLAGRHRDKAGGYAVQARHDPVIEKVVGEYEAVVGLSLRTLRRLLVLFRSRRGRRGCAPSRRVSETRV